MKNKHGIFGIIIIVSALALVVSVAGCTTQQTSTSNGTTSASPSSSPSTMNITDFAGRVVTIPANVTRIVSLHPIPTFIVWRLAPKDLMSIDNYFAPGMEENMNPSDISYLSSLPVTGVYFAPPNTEQILALQPQVVITLNKDPNANNESALYDAPVVELSKNNLTDYVADFKIMGEIVGNENEGNALADFWNNTIANITAQVAKVPGPKPKVLYYNTINPNSPSLPGPDSVFSSEVRLAGGINYYDVNPVPTGQDSTSEGIATDIESVLAWDPDIIITTSNATATEILTSPVWSATNAVKNGRVYTVPKDETMDGVQSIMGTEWAATVINPGKVNLDFVNDTKTYFALFTENDSVSTQTILTASP